MEEKVTSDLVGQRDLRIQKLQQLVKLGINPYPSKSFRKDSIGDILEDFEKFEEALTEVLTYIRTTPHNELESESEKENESAG